MNEDNNVPAEAAWLAAKLKELGKTPSLLAAELGLPNPRTIHNWLAGRREVPALLRPALWAIEQGWRADTAPSLEIADEVLRKEASGDHNRAHQLFLDELGRLERRWVEQFEAEPRTAADDLVRALMRPLMGVAVCGHSLIQQGAAEAVEAFLAPALARVYGWVESVRRPDRFLRSWRHVPRVLTYNLFFLWGLAAVCFERWEILGKLFMTWMPSSIEQPAGGFLWSTDVVFHPETWGRSATRTFDEALNWYQHDQAASRVAHLYGDAFLTHGLRMDFLLVLFSAAKARPEERETLRYPNFRRYPVRQLEPMWMRLVQDDAFCERIASMFGESCEAFRVAYAERARSINTVRMSEYKGFLLEPDIFVR